jgi:DNA-binding PadR family transcriptional regulator
MNNAYVSSYKNKYSLTELGKDYLQKHLEKGESYKTIAKEFDINPDNLSTLGKKYGIQKDNRRKFSLNESYFERIDTKEKAYWLGFLSADGSISEDRGRVDITL